MHKVFYKKLQKNEGSATKFGDNKSPCTILASSSTAVMIIEDLNILATCLEGFLFGLYSGIFVILVYLQFSSDKSRTANIVFYVLCVLYVLSTILFASDLLTFSFEFSPQLQIDYWQSISLIIYDVQRTAFGCCDFVSQCILIYRCWIVWGQNIRFVIIPSFLAITFLATWLALNGGPLTSSATWDMWDALGMTSLAASMVVNALVTGLIVFRILKVSLEIKPTSVERTLSSTKGNKFRHITFVIIESGMALFAIQLVRVVMSAIPVSDAEGLVLNAAIGFVVATHQALTGIAPTIILVRVSMTSSFDDEDSFKEAIESLCFNNPPSDTDTLQRMGSSGSMSLQDFERNEDNITPSDPNILRRVESSNSITIVPRERSGDSDIQVCPNNPLSNPEYTSESANGM